jgi:hypothetical protein
LIFKSMSLLEMLLSTVEDESRSGDTQAGRGPAGRAWNDG